MGSNSNHISVLQIAPRLDLPIIHEGPVGGVRIHQNEPPLVGTKNEIGVMGRRLIVRDDDVTPPIATEHVSADANGKRLAANRT